MNRGTHVNDTDSEEEEEANHEVAEESDDEAIQRCQKKLKTGLKPNVANLVKFFNDNICAKGAGVTAAAKTWNDRMKTAGISKFGEVDTYGLDTIKEVIERPPIENAVAYRCLVPGKEKLLHIVTDETQKERYAQDDTNWERMDMEIIMHNDYSSLMQTTYSSGESSNHPRRDPNVTELSAMRKQQTTMQDIVECFEVGTSSIKPAAQWKVSDEQMRNNHKNLCLDYLHVQLFGRDNYLTGTKVTKLQRDEALKSYQDGSIWREWYATSIDLAKSQPLSSNK